GTRRPPLHRAPPGLDLCGPGLREPTRAGLAAWSDLADRRDLDQELLAPGGVELHVRDALGALAGHLFDTALAEVVVVDAVARGELHIAVVTHLARHGIGEAIHRGRLRFER